MERYADGKEWNNHNIDYYDDDNYVDEKGVERYCNTHFKHVQRNDFHVKRIYAKETCVTIVCKSCGADKFTVGQGGYFTAIKCDKCGWERCIHDG